MSMCLARVGAPSRIGWLLSHKIGKEITVELATAPTLASLEMELGPEVPGAAREPCLEQMKLFVDQRPPSHTDICCRRKTGKRSEVQAASLRVLVQPPVLLPLG